MSTTRTPYRARTQCDPEIYEQPPRRHSVPTAEALYVRCSIFPHLLHRLSSHALPLCLEARDLVDKTSSHLNGEDSEAPNHLTQFISAPTVALPPAAQPVVRSSPPLQRPPDNHVTFIQIAALDMDRAQTFYENVFGWHFSADRSYSSISTGTYYAHEVRLFTNGTSDVPAGGLLRYLEEALRAAKEDKYPEQQPVVAYVNVADVESSLRQVVSAGGSVVVSRWMEKDLPVQLALFTDTEGNMMGLIHEIEDNEY